ncbi:MAG: hypothetical protein A3I66_14690 [Burkholderiales bacterium RIFCSPLOWO2_02_FULL_57_36]|nr:MAG: hypothetical protein A3I66_14690 [Burkholderiales bacterium RIFCSPLOWO2_02_FULL_57_36]
MEKVFADYSRDTAPYFPFAASENGARKYDSVLANNLSDEYRAGLKRVCSAYLNELGGIYRAELPRQSQLSYDIFAYRLNTCIKSFAYNWHLMPINQASGWPSTFPAIGAGKGSHPFKTVQNYDDFLKRIDGFVVWIDSAIANMRIGIARGITQPRGVMVKVIPQLDAHIVDSAQKSIFYQPLTKFPDDFDELTRKRLTEQYTAAIEQKIVPTYRKLRAFIQDEYLPKCRTSHGLRDIPDGADMYLLAVKDATTTDMRPDQIYDIGIAEVARITAEMKKLEAEIDAERDAPLAQYQDVESLLNGYRDLRASVEKELPKLFGHLPKTDFEIRAIEPYREKSMSSSYIFPPIDGKRPGIFYLNAAALRGAGYSNVSRSLFIHETIPGHHLQIALQRENKELPLFRRIGWYNAFGEGWALYAESLGADLGMYRNRRDRMTMLSDELYRAARLVVDVGLHDKGWSREKAIDYMRGAGKMSPDSAEREVERYMVWPAQALSYKIGQMKILEIRRKAEARLGSAFDVRAFHDELLRDGAMPLDILEAKMDSWIAAQQQ